MAESPINTIAASLGLYEGFLALMPDVHEGFPKASWKSPSDCRNCSSSDGKSYHPTKRCCTYYPFVTNFQLGLLLRESVKFESVIKSLLSKNLLLPCGLLPSKLRVVAYGNAVTSGGYLNLGEPQCDFVDAWGCSIHEFRGPACFGWYCRSNEFSEWLRALEAWFHHCFAYLWERIVRDFGLDPMVCVKAQQVSHDGYSHELLREVWGQYHGHELEFYRGCGSKFLEIINSDSKGLMEQLLSDRTMIHFDLESQDDKLWTQKIAANRLVSYKSGLDLWNQVLNRLC